MNKRCLFKLRCAATTDPLLEHRVGGLQVALGALMVALIAGCAQTPTPPVAAVEKPAAPVAPAPPSPAVAPPVLPAPAPRPATESTVEGTAVIARRAREARAVATTEALTPSGKMRYACEKPGARADIVLPEGSARICSRFPAMGPCQYERNACRAGGGRVIRFDGVEITKDVEQEYDKQVQRFRLNAG